MKSRKVVIHSRADCGVYYYLHDARILPVSDRHEYQDATQTPDGKIHAECGVFVLRAPGKSLILDRIE